MDDAVKALARELNGAAPEGLQPLGGDGVARIAELVAAAKREQAEAIDTAIHAGLDAVPLLLRRPVRKVLFG
jgi:hypothetical protein